MNKYIPTIGLEIHAELRTKTKMFCDCPNSLPAQAGPNAMPNTNVCPVCLGHPGTLPVINKKAIESMIKIGLAIDGEINENFKFDRKNYFYPDLPKGYQISQFDMPIVKGGSLDISALLGTQKVVKINRVHLEEDAAKLMHATDKGAEVSLVDYNRGGVPLMELVSEPDMHSAEEAVAFAKEFQLILRYLGVSDADLERGQMRFDVNVSIARSNSGQIQTNGNQIFEKNSVLLDKNSSDARRIVLKDESYHLMGLLFEVHNKLGSTYKEKNYQDAIEAILQREKIPFEREKKVTLKFDNLDVSNFLADFIINNQIILEIKATKFITQEDIRQTLRYIKSADLPLGIIVNFRSGKLESKRVINPKFGNNSAIFEENSGEITLGTRSEIKNLNSFSALESAVNYEIQRQTEILEDGGKINQETRGWDDVKKLTVSQRSKEESHDYRYFPEPDLPPLTKDGFEIERLKLEIPELPNAKRKRFSEQFGLSLEQMSVLIQDREMSNYFEQAVSELEADVQKEASAEKVKLILNYLTSDIKGALMTKGISLNQSKLTAENFADLVDMIFKKEISSRVAKDLIVRMIDTGLDPREIVKNEGLGQISDQGGLEETVKKIISANPKAVEDYKAGKTNALQFLVGKAMAELKGRGNPGVLRTLFDEMLK